MSLSYDGINLISCSNVRYKVFLLAWALLPTGWRDQLNMCQAEEEAKANTPPVSCSSRSPVMRSWTLAKLDRNVAIQTPEAAAVEYAQQARAKTEMELLPAS